MAVLEQHGHPVPLLEPQAQEGVGYPVCPVEKLRRRESCFLVNHHFVVRENPCRPVEIIPDVDHGIPVRIMGGSL